jgi:hypothetical protein
MKVEKFIIKLPNKKWAVEIKVDGVRASYVAGLADEGEAIEKAKKLVASHEAKISIVKPPKPPTP